MKKIESISILWGPKVDDLDNISQKILNALLLVTKLLPNIYDNWYELGNSKEEALKKNIILEHNTIKKLLETNIDNQFPNLGTRISLWNGSKSENDEASFSSKLNSNSSRIKNNFVLRFPNVNNLTHLEINPLLENLLEIFKGDELRINGDIINLKNWNELSHVETDNPYRTFEGKDYTQEEWEKYEAEQWKKFKDKDNPE